MSARALRPAAPSSRPPTRRDRLVLGGAVALWLSLVVLAATGLAEARGGRGWLDIPVITAVAVVVGTVWLGGLRTVGIVAAYPVLRHLRWARLPGAAPASSGVADARVALLYCTADDFDADKLLASMRQSHGHVTTIVLDDSSDPGMRARIDAFGTATGARVVRREHRTGFKAGNLNHFLGTRPGFDYYAVLDSDEVLEPTFVRRALDHVAAGSRDGRPVGVVQGRHRTRRGESRFADDFGPMFETHVAVTQLVRSTVGFSFFMGRGALISAGCLEATGGFPEMVMEDLAFSLEAQRAGFDIVYAPDIVSCESYPVDYHAFKKQHGKFTQGTTELARRYARTVATSGLTARQKVDVLVETVMAPVGAALGLLMFVAGLLPVGPEGAAFLPGWMGATLAACGTAPLLAELLRRVSAHGPLAAATFSARALALYASMLWVTIRSAGRVLLGGRAVFTVTPKVRSTAGWRSTALAEIVVAVVALTLGMAVAGSFAPATGLVGCAAAAAWFTWSASRHREQGDALAQPAEPAEGRAGPTWGQYPGTVPADPRSDVLVADIS